MYRTRYEMFSPSPEQPNKAGPFTVQPNTNRAEHEQSRTVNSEDHGPKSAQSRPSESAQSRSKIRPKIVPKSAQSRPKVGPKSPQSWPKVGPKLAPSRSKVIPKCDQRRPNIDAKSAKMGRVWGNNTITGSLRNAHSLHPLRAELQQHRC